MILKKVLVALGLACVVAPAALSASMMINRGGGGSSSDQSPRGPVEAMLASIQQMIEGSRGAGEGKIPGRAGPDTGGNLPFRAANVLMPNLDHLKTLEFGGDRALDGAVATSLPASLPAGAAGGPVGTREGTQQKGSQSNRSLATGGAGGSGFGSGGIGGPGLGGLGGSGSGGSGSGATGGGGATDLALAVDMTEPPAAPGSSPDETLASAPLPASLWMLMGGMVGLAFLGFRRRPGSWLGGAAWQQVPPR